MRHIQRILPVVLMAAALVLAGCSLGAVETVAVPQGTTLEVRLVNRLSSDGNRAGDTFLATVERPVVINGKVVIPAGAEVTGKVTRAVESGKLKQRAELWVTLEQVELRGKTYAIRTSTTGHKEGSKAKRDILFIGGGAGAGAAIGGAAGGGSGALIGAAIGAGAGTVGAMMTGERDIVFPPETLLRFRVQEAVQLPVADEAKKR